MAETKSTAQFVTQVKRDIEKSFRVLQETRTIARSGTGFVLQRIPDEDKLVFANYPDPWADDQQITASVIGFDGTVHSSDNDLPSGNAFAKYGKLFSARPDITTVIHIHTPYLSAWAHAHRSLKLLYAASQRHTLSRELPVIIDRRPSEPELILDYLKNDPHLPGVLEGNGGATIWGHGIIKTSRFIVLLEEGAEFQALAESLGGAKEFGPAVLEEQWSRTGLFPFKDKTHSPVQGTPLKIADPERELISAR